MSLKPIREEIIFQIQNVGPFYMKISSFLLCPPPKTLKSGKVFIITPPPGCLPKERCRQFVLLFLFFPMLTIEYKFYFVKGTGWKLSRDAGCLAHHACCLEETLHWWLLVDRTRCKRSHDECSVTGGTGQEHLLAFGDGSVHGQWCQQGFFSIMKHPLQADPSHAKQGSSSRYERRYLFCSQEITDLMLSCCY